jgi:hypothetical protein
MPYLLPLHWYFSIETLSHKLPPNRQRQQRRLQRCEYLFQDYPKFAPKCQRFAVFDISILYAKKYLLSYKIYIYLKNKIYLEEY